MNGLLLKLAMVGTVGSLLHSIPAATQVSPATNKAARVRITQGPEIERADPDFAIIKWTSNNPGGSPEHYGIVRYGTDPTKLNQTAKSPIRLNPGHSHTVFRVRMDGLKPRTTYYYKVDSMEANGKGDGVKSTVKHFTTPSARPTPISWAANR
jgi:phosphodiesterase/alkaline phosphatase D-like protein